MELPVPELGEGIEQATVVRVLVGPGMAVQEGQDLMEVETEKSTMPIPAPFAGTVERIHVKTGDKVKIGTSVMTLIPAGQAEPSSSQTVPEPAKSTSSLPDHSSGMAQKSDSITTGANSLSSLARTILQSVALPNLGEGITGGTVVNVLVKPGDQVEAEQTLVEVETEKAAIPVPSPAAGTVRDVHVGPGAQVKVGQSLLEIETIAVGAEALGGLPSQPVVAPAPVSAGVPSSASPGRTDVQVINRSPPAASPLRNGEQRAPVPASPATRRLARELGVDLHQVVGSARGGRVTMDDVKAYVRAMTTKGAVTTPPVAGTSVPPMPDFARYGPIERKPFSALRKTIARNLSWSWSIAPQVTQHDLADITELEASRKSFVDAAPKGAPKVTMTVLAIKACVAALKAFPHFNASYDPNAGENGELIIKKYYHIGIAVDTERGLVVPVIRNADQKSIGELAKEVAQLAEKARAGKLLPDEMRGGTFTITNLGGIGGTAFSPIINYPEVAILGLSRSSWQPVVREGRVEPRLMLPLSLTYDHRVIDGADGARFCARLATLFSDPMRMFFES